MKRKVALVGLGGVGVLALIAIAAVRFQGSRLDVLAKSYGIPTSDAEVKALCRVPDSDNAYALYPAFRDAKKEEDAALGKKTLKMPSLGDIMTSKPEPFEPVEATAYLTHHKGSLAAAVNMATRKKWFVDRDMSSPATIDYAEFPNLKGAVKLLVLDARLKLSRGDRMGALDQYERAVKVGMFPNSEPTLIGVLVYIACESVVVQSLAMDSPVLAADPVTERKTIAILDSIERPDLARAMKGESYFQFYYVKNGLPPDAFRDASDDGEGGGDKAKVAFLNSTRGIWGPDLMKHEGEIVQSAQGNDYGRFASQMAQTEKWMATSGSSQWVANMLLPVFSNSGIACQRLLVTRDLVRLGIQAMSSHRVPNVNGTTDPFSGGPYKLITQPHGWKIYSYGMDRLDGGGVIDPSSPAQTKDVILSYDGQAFLVGH